MFARLTLAAIAMASIVSAQTPSKDSRPIMARVFDDIQTLLPLSLSSQEFSSNKNKRRIGLTLANLTDNAHAVAKHFQTKGEDYRYVAKSFARDVYDAKRLFQLGEHGQAQFIIQNLTENCVSCHTKLPNKSRFPHPDQMFAKMDKLGLEGFDLAHFKVMARQFDKALELYEAGFKREPEALDSSIFVEYLKIAMRVNGDARRVATLLNSVPKKKLNNRIKKNVAAWKKTAKSLIKNKSLQTLSIANATGLIAAGEKNNNYQSDDAGLLYFTAGSAILNRLLSEGHHLSAAKRSEIYHLLGKTEEQITDTFWISETENYLEQSIRLAPQSPWAQRSFRMLKDLYVFNYSGSSGMHLPEDVLHMLDELESLIVR